MRLTLTPLLVLASAAAVAQSPTFAEPVRLKAGDKFLGKDRPYPSPVYHDMDRDGRADIVVGDLAGNLTVAPRTAGALTTFGAEYKVMDAEGKLLDLQNW
ncbi:MAG TPA: hypothetical protein VF384_13085 [Planctomycetota bacterium]